MFEYGELSIHNFDCNLRPKCEFLCAFLEIFPWKLNFFVTNSNTFKNPLSLVSAQHQDNFTFTDTVKLLLFMFTFPYVLE